jgi:vacuolar-type H+-ATPase subunit H
MSAQLSPLDQIRAAEADVTRKIAKARKDREHILAKTRAQANEMMIEAQESGRLEGQRQYRQILSEAEEDAKAILAEAKQCAQELQHQGSQYLNTAVRHVVIIVCGMEEAEK